MVWWIPIAMAAASAIGQGVQNKRQKASRNKQYNQIRDAGGLANKNSSIGALTNQFENVDDEGAGGYMRQLLSEFMGTENDLDVQAQRQRPWLPGTIAGTNAFKYAQGFDDPNRLPRPEDLMQGYGSAAGMQAQGMQRGNVASRNALARSGLGSSGAMASLAGQQSQALGNSQADLYSRMHGAMLQQKMQNAQIKAGWANNAYDMQRDIVSLSLGSSPQPRTQNPQQDLWGPLAGMAGQVLGGYLGSGADSSYGNNIGRESTYMQTDPGTGGFG